ncbi:phage holin family protein [Endozoicomonas sp. SCSIO W0465]
MLPVTIITLGLFSRVINVLILTFSGKVVDCFEIKKMAGQYR